MILGLQGMVGATTSEEHPRRAAFAEGVAQAIRPKCEADVAAVVNHIMKDKKYTYAAAVAHARSPAMSSHVRTFAPPPEGMAAAVEEVMGTHRSLDDHLGPVETPLLLPHGATGKSGAAGAEQVLASLTQCILKGCASDPLPMQEM